MLSAVITTEHSYPAMPLAGQLVHQWFVHPGPLVLGTNLLSLPTPTADRDRTVSRRSEPSSRTALNGEQPYPWDLLQPQDAMSRHRGAKPPRRCELLGEISLLSPGYLLSFERWSFHSEPPDHYDRLSVSGSDFGGVSSRSRLGFIPNFYFLLGRISKPVMEPNLGKASRLLL